MESTTEHNGQLTLDDLTPEQLIWAAQVHLAAMATLWGSVPVDERAELVEETLESFDESQLFAYSVLFVESLGFDVQPLAAADRKTAPAVDAGYL